MTINAEESWRSARFQYVLVYALTVAGVASGQPPARLVQHVKDVTHCAAKLSV